MRRKVPTNQSQKKFETEMANFKGMNNTQHPTLLPLNTPSNLQNSYFQDGILTKRNGYTKFGTSVSSGITETFDTTTYKDTTGGVTTANWDTVNSVLKLTLSSELNGGYNPWYSISDLMPMSVGRYEKLGQSFKCIESGYLSSIKVKLIKHLSPTGNMVAKIFTHSGVYGSTSVPGTLLATSDILDVSTVSSAGVSEYIFTFTTTNPLLLNNSYYVFGLEYSGGDLNNYINVIYKSGNFYNGNASQGTSSYVANNSIDLYFYTYVKQYLSPEVGQSLPYDTGTVSPTYQINNSYSLNGGSIVFEYSSSANGSTGWDAWTTDITTLSKRYIRWRATITGSNTSTPTVETITITYSGKSIVSSHSWTKPGTTEKYLFEVADTNLYMYDSVDGDYKIIKANLTTGLRTTAVGFSEGVKSYFIITNGTDSVMRFNGKVSTGTNVTIGGAGHTTVTGTGTTWKNTPGHMDQLVAGGRIKIGTTWYTIASLTDDTHLEISVAGTDGTYAYEAYAVNVLGGLTTAGIGGTELKGKYVTTYKNQVMISGIVYPAGYESWVHVSAYLSGTTWSYTVDASGNPTFTNGSGAININTNDGQIITALVPFGNSVYIHKSDIYGTKKSINSLTRNVESWTNVPVSTQYAAISQTAIVSTPNAFYFIDRSGIVVGNGVTFNKIDNDISATTSLFNQTCLQNSVAAYNVQEGNEFLFFGVPIGTATTNDHLLMYDIQQRGWGLMNGLNIGCFAIYSDVYTPELYFGDQLANSQVLKWNSGTSDNGAPIEWIVETGELLLKQYFENKKMKYLYAFFEPTGDYIVHAYYSLNGGPYVELTETITVDGTSSDVFKRWSLPGLKGSSIKFKFYNNEKDQPITLVRAGVVMVDKGLRRI